ncbi:14713_t:CDS:2, partial [Entrophospora sp. SA101]
ERKFSAKNYADLVFNSDYEFEEQLKEFHIKKKISYQQKLESLDSQVTVFAVNKKLNSNVINTGDKHQEMHTIDIVAGENYIGESNITEELQRTRDMLKMSESEHQKQSIIILDLNNKIMQLQQQLKNYEHEVSELKKNLDTSYNHIDEIQNLYEEQFSKNKYLLEQWDSYCIW